MEVIHLYEIKIPYVSMRPYSLNNSCSQTDKWNLHVYVSKQYSCVKQTYLWSIRDINIYHSSMRVVENAQYNSYGRTVLPQIGAFLD